MIVSRARRGLCNRMRVIAATYRLGKRLNRDTKVLWAKNKEEINARFSDLFEKSNVIEVEDIRSDNGIKELIKSKLHSQGKNRISRYVLRGIQKLYYDEVFDEFNARYLEKNHIKKIKRSKNTFINSCYEFIETKSKDYRDIFEPVDSLKKEIERSTDRIGQNTIGVHIRRSDHKKAVKGSPEKEFVKVMNREVNVNDKVNFYLATDSSDVKSKFKSLFGEKLTLSKVPITRKNREGIRGAIIDLYCLSKTRKIYGSLESSFTRVAAELGDIDHVFLRPNVSKLFREFE